MLSNLYQGCGLGLLVSHSVQTYPPNLEEFNWTTPLPRFLVLKCGRCLWYRYAFSWTFFRSVCLFTYYHKTCYPLETLTELGLGEIYLEKQMHENENIKALGNKLLSKYWLVKWRRKNGRWFEIEVIWQRIFLVSWQYIR